MVMALHAADLLRDWTLGEPCSLWTGLWTGEVSTAGADVLVVRSRALVNSGYEPDF